MLGSAACACPKTCVQPSLPLQQLETMVRRKVQELEQELVHLLQPQLHLPMQASLLFSPRLSLTAAVAVAAAVASSFATRLGLWLYCRRGELQPKPLLVPLLRHLRSLRLPAVLPQQAQMPQQRRRQHVSAAV